MFWKFNKKDDSHEFRPILAEIEEEPISPLGRTTFWIVIAIFLFTVAWTCIGQVDVVVSARGEIIPDGEVKIIQPLDTGVISKIIAKEGAHVKKGETLIEIDPSSVQPTLKSMQKNLNYTNLEIKRLKATSEGTSFLPVLPTITVDSDTAQTQADLYNSSVNSLKDQIAAKQLELKRLQEQINSANADLDSVQRVLDLNIDKERRYKEVMDIISKVEYQEVVEKVTEYTGKVKEAKYKIEELNHQKDQTLREISYLKESFKSQNLKDVSDRQKAAAQLEGQIQEASFKSKKQKITSPVDGYIVNMSVHTVGGVVTPAEKLISIVPSNSPLVIKSKVLNKDIGFIKEGQDVAVKIDTFDFQKYGILKGKVRHVSESSTMDQKLGQIYEVYITPVNTTLMVEGKRKSITSGMTLSSEIKVNKRRIIEFFIYPLVKYYNEGISVR